MGEFILDRWQDITFRAYQHTSLVLQSVLLALVIALIIAVLISSHHRATAIANSLTSIGLTLPSLALLGLAIPLFGIGTHSVRSPGCLLCNVADFKKRYCRPSNIDPESLNLRAGKA